MSGFASRVWQRRRPTVLVIYRAASDVAAKGVMFALTVLAARRLSRDDFGLFALASTIGWLGSVAADFGIQVHLARAVSQHPERSAELLRRWLPVRISTGVVALIISLLVLPSLGFTGAARLPMYLFTLAYAASGLSEYHYYFFRGLGRSDLESTLILLQRGGLAVLAGAALWWQPSVSRLALAMLAPALATLAAAALLARRLAATQAAPVQDASLTRREFVSSVAPIGLGILLSALYFRVDVFLLEHWRGTSEVALYNAVFRLVEALRLVPAAVLAVALPELFRATNTTPLRRLAAPLTAGALCVTLTLWFTASRVVLALYGTAFSDAVEPFQILLLSLPLMALNYALTHQLIGWHGHRAYAVICAGALACNVLLNWRLIPAMGMSGAAWSTLWTETFLTLGCAVALRHVRVGLGATLTAARGQMPMEAQ